MQNVEPYKFSLTEDERGWRWDILGVYYTWRDADYYYETLDFKGGTPIFGYEITKKAAAEAGRNMCQKLILAHKRKEQREIHSLSS